MDFPVELLINALIARNPEGGYYAAVMVGISISFGTLDIVNIAHPAFIILGSYIAYIANHRLGLDPILTSILVPQVFYYLGSLVYQVRPTRRGQEALRSLAFFFGLSFVLEVVLILVFGVNYRHVQVSYFDTSSRCCCCLGLQLFLIKTFTGCAIMAVTQDQLALSLMAADPNSHQTHRVWDLNRLCHYRGRPANNHPAGRAVESSKASSCLARPIPSSRLRTSLMR